MFNLLVKYSPWEDGRDSLPRERLFEYTDSSLVAKLAPQNQLNLESLRTLPTLFVQENSGQGNQVAHVGIISRLRESGRNIVIDYSYDSAIPGIPNSFLRQYASDLEIEDFQFTRTHWSVKEVDLYRVLVKAAPPRRQRPSVFELAEYPNIEPSLVSVMMPFDLGFNSVYAALQRTAKTVGLICRRADDIWENPAIIQDVVSLIDRSKIVICDCTGRNPNVFYEIGIAHTLGREVILITQSDADIPFDLRHLRYVRYLNNAEGLETLGSLLAPRLANLSE